MTMTMTMTAFEADCRLCVPLAGPERLGRAIVVETAHWQVATFPGYEVPGWYFFQATQHVNELADLPVEALAEFGPRLAEVIAAIQSAAGCEKVYVQRFGETHRHWHVLLCARPDSVPSVSHGPRYLLDRELLLDEVRSRDVTDQLRVELADWRAAVAELEAGPSSSNGGM